MFCYHAYCFLICILKAEIALWPVYPSVLGRMYSTCILAECVVSKSVDNVEDY
jgi:hypothetical protein